MIESEIVKSLLEKAANKKRLFVAIAGPPASGKTTFCQSLQQSLSKETSVAIVAMDGFHYDNSILHKLNLFDRKGSPQTFDVAGLHLLLSGLQHQTSTLAAPVFDREKDLARSSASLIEPKDHIVLIEGNYLLCNTEPWDTLHSVFDVTIGLDVSLKVLEERLIQRWVDHNHTPDEAKQRTNHNDLPNAKYVIDNSITADLIVKNQTPSQ